MLTDENILKRLTPAEVKYLKLLFALKIGRYKGVKELEEFNTKQEVSRKIFLGVLNVGARNLEKTERAMELLGFVEKFKRRDLFLIFTKEGMDFVNYALTVKNEKFI